MVDLRPHHLLCILTYAGRGYSPAFVRSFDRIARAVSAGCTIRIVDGPDDVCAPLDCDPDRHCLSASVRWRDEEAARALAMMLGPLPAGRRLRLTRPRLDQLRAAFAAGQVRGACRMCEWAPLCDGIAAAGFTGTRLLDLPTTGDGRHGASEDHQDPEGAAQEQREARADDDGLG